MTTVLDSLNSPLRIDSLLLAEGGAIGMTICPGKKRPGSISGNWIRDLEIDLQVVRDWGAEIVVTLLEDFEIEEVQIGPLGDKVESLGMQWIHLPIPDKQAPGENFAPAWAVAGAQIHACLKNGGKILIHCMGGIGRTGTIAAQILIERGIPVDLAIAEVRRVRQGAIETVAQEEYLAAYGNQLKKTLPGSLS